jgi:hypothetical protein
MQEQKQPKIEEPEPVFSVDFYEEEIQSFAEGNFGRELTDLELYRMQYWYEGDDTFWEKTELLACVIKMAMDPRPHWCDEDYKSKQN